MPQQKRHPFHRDSALTSRSSVTDVSTANASGLQSDHQRVKAEGGTPGMTGVAAEPCGGVVPPLPPPKKVSLLPPTHSSTQLWGKMLISNKVIKCLSD